MESNRVTIMISEKNLKTIRSLQAKLIVETNQNWSFGKTLELVLSIGMGAKDYKDIIEQVIKNKGKK